MSQLKRIGDMIGSFVSKDYKRKRLDEEEDETNEDDSPFKTRKGNSLSGPEYLKRVSTFKDFIWCRGIPALSPLEIARHGWSSTQDQFMVRCVSCSENLSLVIPPPDSGIRESSIKTAVGRLSSAHAEFCPWSASPNPIDWTRVQVPDFDQLAVTACEISGMGVKLPYLKPEVQQDWTGLVPMVQCEVLKEVGDKEVQTTSSILALCGWKVGAVEDTLEDCYGVRRIGIWNFVSIQDEEDMQEARRVALELGGDTRIPSPTPPGSKQYLEPLKEHMSWNPLLQKRDGVPGWRYIISQVNSKKMRTQTPEQPTKGKRDSITVIKKVRDMLDQW